MTIRTLSDLREYQRTGVTHQCSMPQSMLWLDPGLGKTVITLTSINHLIKSGFLHKVLILAPVKVCKMVWRQEAKKWAHTENLRFSCVTGSPTERVRALLKDADIYLINYENMKWLSHVLHYLFIKKGKEVPFNGIVFDEVSKMKNSSTNRVRSFMKIRSSFKWFTGLTGTPASNGYKDLHGQYLVIDGGERLGRTKTEFKGRYYHKVNQFIEVANDGAEADIKHLISPITLEMSSKDYLSMPEFIVNDIEVEMPKHAREHYEALERELFTKLDSGAEIELTSSSALINKCLQLSSGAVYLSPGEPLYEDVHNDKIEALEDLVDELQGKPILLAYQFKSDADRIMKHFSSINPINLTACKSQRSLDVAMRKWNNGECKLMIGHPASMGHGIDGLQAVGSALVWFGMNWSLEYYEQFNARLHRQGQKHPVVCHRIVCKDTVDFIQLERLASKDSTQNGLRKAVEHYRQLKGV